MNINAFLTCLGYFGVSTGSSAILEGVYSPSSGTTGYLFNQIYATGLHESGSLIYSPVIPLINVGRQLVTNTRLSGNQCLRAGYQHNGNFGVLMDIGYSGCQRGTSSGKHNVLFSTVENTSGLSSGFCITINDANRLNFKTQNKGYTLNNELSTRDMVYVSLTEKKYVSFGIFSLKTNEMFSSHVTLDEALLNTNSMYIGGQLNYSAPYTGYSGQLNNVFIFSDNISNSDVGICANCSLITGFSITNVTENLSGYQITGLYYSGYQTTGLTGFGLVTGLVKKSDDTYISVLISSGLSGYTYTGEVATPQLSNFAIQTSGDVYTFTYDQNELNSFTTSSVEFDFALSSGDIVEIYTHSVVRPNLNKLVNGFIWPEDTGVIQIIGNGLNETSGIDYQILHNTLSGFDVTDILAYDALSGASVVTAFSGYWADSKVLMSGGSYYPPQAQYTELNGVMTLTGISGVTVSNPYYPNFGYDLFLNGQKLISGIHYDATGMILNLSGQKLPLLSTYPLFHPTGGLPTGFSEVLDSELTFLPQISGFRQKLLTITGNVKNIGSITGFSEQVWVNGLRQTKGYDYLTHNTCDTVSSILYRPATTYNLYSSQNDAGNKWNFPLLPKVYQVDFSGRSFEDDGLYLGVDWQYYSHVYPVTGLFAQAMIVGTANNYTGYATVSNSFHVKTGVLFFDNIANYGISIGEFSGYLRIRYGSGNSYGPWSLPSETKYISE
jgi:hypothetical protein